MYDLFQNKKCICLELKTPQQLAEYSKIAYELWKSQTFMCNVLTKSITKKCKKTLLKKILNGWKRMENWTYEHKNFMLILYKGSLHKNAKLYWLLKQLDIPIIKYDKSKVKEHMEYANKRFYEICIEDNYLPDEDDEMHSLNDEDLEAIEELMEAEKKHYEHFPDSKTVIYN